MELNKNELARVEINRESKDGPWHDSYDELYFCGQSLEDYFDVDPRQRTAVLVVHSVEPSHGVMGKVLEVSIGEHQTGWGSKDTRDIDEDWDGFDDEWGHNCLNGDMVDMYSAPTKLLREVAFDLEIVWVTLEKVT